MFSSFRLPVPVRLLETKDALQRQPMRAGSHRRRLALLDEPCEDGSSNKRVRQEANSVLPYGHPISEPHIPRYEVARRRIAFMPDSSPDPG